MNERALVLGGGGPAGIAWEVGLVAGLAAERVDLRRADFIFGTSAGSFVGGQLAKNFDPQALAELHLSVARRNAGAASAALPPVNPLHAFMARNPTDREPSIEAMRELGAVSLRSKTIPEDAFVRTFAGMFGPNPEWPDRFACTAVSARDGQFKLFTREDGVPIERAVAASCSVPGIFPAITIGDTQYMDGGVRSWTNADCAAGYRRVIMVAVVLPELQHLLIPVAERERATLEAGGSRVALIVPDAGTRSAVGENPLDRTRNAATIEAGIAQGKAEAARVAALWND